LDAGATECPGGRNSRCTDRWATRDGPMPPPAVRILRGTCTPGNIALYGASRGVCPGIGCQKEGFVER
jgi:hypothetical protein